MADYLNKTFLKGRLGKDPELRFLPSGDAVCNFNIATRSGQHVEWHRIVIYKKLAEYAKEKFATGDLVYVEAEIKTREMQSADDKLHPNRKPRKITELIADVAHLVEKRGGAATESEDALPGGDDDAQDNQDSDNPGEGSSLPKYI